MADNLKHNVVSYGEVLWDLLPDKSIIGGAPFNFTYRINSLGNNGMMVSRVGDDPMGRQALQKIWNLGLSLDYIQNDRQHPTGTVDIFFDDKMNPDFTINRDAAYDYIEHTTALERLCRSAECFCYGTLAQRNKVSRNTLFGLFDLLDGAVCFYDINLRKECYSTGVINDSLTKANIVKLNDTEAVELKEILSFSSSGLVDTGKYITEAYDIEVCLITLGENGVLAVSQSGEICYVPGHKVKLADPLGAGDAFSAGFIHEWLNNRNISEACRFGNILGAVVATQKGATVPIKQGSIDSVVCHDNNPNIDKTLEKHII